jgi:diadenosine tetraphosphate (Ap4A) HIT family hydrolase
LEERYINNSMFNLIMGDCKYCDEDYQKSDRTILENNLFFANYDNHPVNLGHVKLISKRHVNSLCELSNQELTAMIDLMIKIKELIDKEYHPEGYNIGINEGKAAGQTVFHLHVHLIPRYEGDVHNPVGGVRNIIPEKGDYLKNS